MTATQKLPRRSFEKLAGTSWARLDQAGTPRGGSTLLKKIGILVVTLVIHGAPMPAHAAPAYPEEAVEAVFLYRFAGYVTWPEAMRNAPRFTIAVLGAESVAEELSRFLPQHPIHGKPARVAIIGGLSQLGDAQMLYIGPDIAVQLRALLEALKGHPILIVTDQPGALEEGSMVNFIIEQQHVRFEISTVAAKRSGLQIDSGLLTVAERVKTSDLREMARCPPFGDGISPCPAQLAKQWIHPVYLEGE